MARVLFFTRIKAIITDKAPLDFMTIFDVNFSCVDNLLAAANIVCKNRFFMKTAIFPF